MSPKIATVLTRLGAGGPPIQALLLTREMKKLGYRMALVTGSCDAQDGDMSYLLAPEDEVHLIPEMSRSVSPWNDLAALLRLYFYFRKERPDIVHTHTAKAGALGRLAARLAGVPGVVHTFHGNVLAHYFSPMATRGIRWIERLLGHATDAICALCPQQAGELADLHKVAPRDKVHVVPFGMDLSPYSRVPPAPRSGRLVAGWLGRLVAIKDVPLLASIVREVLRRTDRVDFIIAGDGPERPRVEALAAEAGARCRFVGWRRDVEPVLARCHLLMQTSRNEGTPVALIQGMAAARPFLATPVGGVVDMVAGPAWTGSPGARWFRNAVLAPPRPEAFAAALVCLAAEPHRVEAMGQSAAEFAERHYTLEALTGALDRIYQGLLAGSPAGNRLCTRWSSSH